MKVLFIGGTGVISSACSRLAVERGVELYLLNRGKSIRPAPKGARVLHADMRDPASVRAAIGNLTFDAVVDWIAFVPEHIEADLEVFRGRTGHYVFISSASVYKTPPSVLPITESTILDNPFWEYSRNKIACEQRLVRAFREEKFPFTIVRPSHTYDCTQLPMEGGWTVVNRMLKGKKVIVFGDGTSLWTLTHHDDFAVGLMGLLANAHAVGEIYHITSDELLSWNRIFDMVARAAGAAAPDIIHVPSEVIAAFDPEWGSSLLGDKSHCMIFDNAKIKRCVPDFTCRISFSHGVREILAWYHADPKRRVIDEKFDRLCDSIVAAQERAFPGRPEQMQPHKHPL
jgi:nucleoside-diphosphate-sugar epimerase